MCVCERVCVCVCVFYFIFLLLSSDELYLSHTEYNEE